MRNQLAKLYNAVPAPVAATRDALTERLQSVRETASLLYNKIIDNIGCGRQKFKDIVEEEAREEEKEEEQQQDDEEYDTVLEINLVHEGRHVKEFRVTGNLNNVGSTNRYVYKLRGDSSIEECEQKRLDLENEEVWSKAYLPTTRTIETQGNYEGKVIFRHV